MYEQGTPVLIEWIDSAGPSDGWSMVEDLADGMDPCMSAGLVVNDTKQFITIAAAMTPEGQCYCPLAIPHCAITQIEELGPKPKPKAKKGV